MAMETCDVCEKKSANLDDGICQVCLTVAACHPNRAKRYNLNKQINSRTRWQIKLAEKAAKWSSR